MPADFLERLRRIAGAPGPSAFREFDPSDDLQLERAATLLLRRFRIASDVAAYELLVDLTASRLVEIAGRVARECGLADDPEELLAGFFEHLFADVRSETSGPEDMRFLARAAAWMRAHAEQRVKGIVRSDASEPEGPVRWNAGGTPAVAVGVDEVHARTTRICFHRLHLPQRRVLLARHLEGLQSSEVARQFAMNTAEVEATLLEATAELARTIAKAGGHVAHSEKMARLLYQLARSCMGATTDAQSRNIRWFEDPKPVRALRGELTWTAAGTSLWDELCQLPHPGLSDDLLLRCAHKSLDLAVRLEGRSPRLEMLRAECIRAGGGLAESAEYLSAAIAGGPPAPWHQMMNECLQAALMGLDQPSEVLAIGADLLKHEPDRPLAAFNMLIAFGWMERRSSFASSARRFRGAAEDVQDRDYFVDLIEDEAPWLADKFRLDPMDVKARLTPASW